MTQMTDMQGLSLALLSILASSLSIMGSSAIIHSILYQYRHGGCPSSSGRNSHIHRGIQTYERLLLSMSFCDVFCSAVFVLQAFMTPKGSFGPLSIGNNNTCRAIGTMNQVGFAAFIYYAMLSYYYVLTIRFSIKNDTLAHRIEPFMHIVALGWTLVTGMVGGIVDFYGTLELFPICWVAVYPKECSIDDTSCNKGPLIAWLIAGDVFIFVTASITVNNILIYRHVYDVYKHSMGSNPGLHDTNSSGDVNSSNLTLSTTGAIDGGEAQRKRIRKVAFQGFLYVVGGWMISLPFFFLQMLEAFGFTAQDQSRFYWLMVLEASFHPLGGFFNALIYFRPRYQSARSHVHPIQATRLEAISIAMFGKSLPFEERKRSAIIAGIARLAPSEDECNVTA